MDHLASRLSCVTLSDDSSLSHGLSRMQIADAIDSDSQVLVGPDLQPDEWHTVMTVTHGNEYCKVHVARSPSAPALIPRPVSIPATSTPDEPLLLFM